MYTISHIVTCICCNSCNLFNITQTHRNTLSCNDLQMVITIQKPNFKANCKSPHFSQCLVMPYYEHEGLMNHILLFGASCITIQTITTKPKFVSQKPPLKLFHQPSWYGIGTQFIFLMIWFSLALMVAVLLQTIALSVGFWGTMFNTPHTMSISIFKNFLTIVCENMNPTIGSNSGKMTIIVQFGVDANGSCVDLQMKKINTIMFMRIPLWPKGQICTLFPTSKNFFTFLTA